VSERKRLILSIFHVVCASLGGQDPKTVKGAPWPDFPPPLDQPVVYISQTKHKGVMLQLTKAN